MSAPLGFEDFHPRIGQSFTLHSAEERSGEEHSAEERSGADGAGQERSAGDGAGELVLLECTLGASHGRSRSFSLLFRGGPDAPREQGSYLLSREDFGPSPIFLVPVRATPDGVEFHAVFNQLTEE
ncbi:MAG TPA: hypothetical protein VF612_11840 [Jatrophihabitans sp.]|jgi:hypothetical protein|uniref:DUF6916 family protein n=1 Tax=Jatrophihabitans sp. TaxID=1932789 RepID=UPI002F1976C3